MLRPSKARQHAALNVVKELDAFPKIPESYQETTAASGGVSLLVFVFILILVVSEVQYYSASELKYKYEVDAAFEGTLKINMDITVAMKCEHIGADVLDLTGQSAQPSDGGLKEEPVHYALSQEQERYMQMIRHVNEYIKNEYHAIHDFLWQTGYTSVSNSMPKRKDTPDTPHDACRVHGSVVVNKVAGNFHITAGKSIPVLPRGHAHLAMFIDESEYNFTHRINHFSYGEPTGGLVNPLDGEEKVVTDSRHMFQYFVQVVPTRVKTWSHALDTFQYSVTERNRSINHSKGSHGVPGIFVKYDLAPLKVIVHEEHKPYWQFLIRLCGIIGGVYATSGVLHGLVSVLVDLVCCRYGWGRHAQAGLAPPSPPPQQTPHNPQTNSLLLGATTLPAANSPLSNGS